MNNYRGPIEEVYTQDSPWPVTSCGCRYGCPGLVTMCKEHSPYQIPGLKKENSQLRVLLQQARDLIKDGWEYSGSHTVGMKLVAEIDEALGKE